MNKFMTVLCFLTVSATNNEFGIKENTLTVDCSNNTMKIEIIKKDDEEEIYLQQLKDFPDPSCKPEVVGNTIVFNLNLKNIFECTVTKVVNKKTGYELFYKKVIIHRSGKKQTLLAKCEQQSNTKKKQIVRRDAQVFPSSFQEDSSVEITSEVTGHAPTPILNVGVRQDGVLIDDELNVKPGTPLNMEIYLDNISKDIYGILVSTMEVTDTKYQVERILANGCSLDPYLFENFISVNGDFLKTKFRAFKFPESRFVLFKGTVNVCLDSCNGVQCSNNQIGYGRKKRNIEKISNDPNKVYEISMSTIIKLDCDDCIKSVKANETLELAEVKSFKADENAALSALFEDFESPGINAFEKNHNSRNYVSFCIVCALLIHAVFL